MEKIREFLEVWEPVLVISAGLLVVIAMTVIIVVAVTGMENNLLFQLINN